jgi:hypothetical protein
MSSNINPQNINGAYPVAGQDNDSQGFRDNFTNIKTNFTFAAAEITDLENKAVLKAALDGIVLNNDMGGSILSNAQLQDMSETRVALGTQSGAQTINYAAGPYYTVTTSGSVNLAFTNFSAAGTVSSVKIQITVTSISHTLTLPAAVGTGDSFTSTQYIQGLSSNVITFNATGTYVFEFTTNDSGASIFIEDLTRNTSVNTLDALTDVTISSPLNNQILLYNSSSDIWVNGNLASTIALDDLSDVDVTSITNGDLLVYDSTANAWVNESSDYIYPLTEYVVTIADNGSGSQDVFFFDSIALETDTGVQFPIDLRENNRYRFDLSSAVNADGPLRFSTTPDNTVTVGNVAPSTITNYSTDVTISGNAGTSGSFVEILITKDTPQTLFFWGIQQDPGLDTSLLGAARPISVLKTQYFAGSDTFGANGNISLETTTTIITSSDDLVGNLAAGSSGQIKILAYGNTSVGNTLITLANAAWGGGSTANLSAAGSAATFQYAGNKWFCTGNNGVTFS